MNLTILTGNIATDIELKNAGQTVVTRFNLAVKNPFKKDETDFIPVEAWGKTAELLNQYCKKGSKIGVEGSIKIDKWQDDNGNNRTFTKVNANRIEFLDTKNSGQQSNNNQSSYKPAYGNNQPQQTRGTRPVEDNPFENGGPVDVNDDDLPF